MSRSHRFAICSALVVATAFIDAGAAAADASNDRVAEAQVVQALPATIGGSTEGAAISKGEPSLSCTRAKGILWYSLKAPRRGPMVVRLNAGSMLEAAVAVYRVVRNRRTRVACRRTDVHGRAHLAWYGYSDGSYLIAVARRAQSENGPYKLTVVAAEPSPRPPGEQLPPGGARATVDPILDALEAWSVQMERGKTYRINLTARTGCLALDLYRPATYSFRTAKPIKSYRCGGYLAFTPGIDGGGLYSLLVRATGTKPGQGSYRLQTAPYRPDDGAPGVKLTNGQSVDGTIFGRGIDVVDIYRFAVPRPNELTSLDLRQRPNVGFDLYVLNETGGIVQCACGRRGRQVIREHLPPGRYLAVVRSRHKSGGRYRLQLFVRDVTTTEISVGGARFVEVASSSPVQLSVVVTSASHGGTVLVEIHRRDPLFGWQFSNLLRGRVSSDGTLAIPWMPPTVGHWRARARFPGTPFSSFSQSGYILMHVVDPLE